MSLGAVAGSLGVVCSKNPIASVLSLLGTLFCLATIYLLAGFEFLAVAQVLVYAGAVMVLFLFVVMLLNLGGPAAALDAVDFVSRRRLPFALGTGIALLLLTFLGILGQGELHAAQVIAGEVDTIDALAELLFGSYLLPFEAASVLLLAAAVAVLVLAKREGRGAGAQRGEATR
jgi:NADH-quinone oxidoreductase subunit J